VEVQKQKRQNRKMTEDLPVLETEVIEPAGVDLPLYRRIGEEVTRVVKHKPGMLYVKEIIRPKYALKDSTRLSPAGQKGVEIAPMLSMPVASASPTPACLTRYCFRSMNITSRSTDRCSSTAILE